MKQRLAVIDHSFHQTTLSTKFIPELLATHYEVDMYWDTSWQGEPNITADQLNHKHYDIIVFVQTILPIKQLRQLQAQIIWIPMYDGVPIDNAGYWLELSTLPLKVISFSQTLAQQLQHYKIDCLPVQFYFDPKQFPQVTDYSTIRIFFWQRTNITFALVRRLFTKLPVHRWVIKINPDPNHVASRPTPAECTQYHITVIEGGYNNKSDYLQLLAQCNVYICPRAYEGIGMSFLEAMAMGLIPIALDHPTMNEYIQSGVTGVLTTTFDPITALDLPNMAKQLKTKAEQGFHRWQQQQTEIIPYLQKPTVTGRACTFGLRVQARTLTYIYYLRLVLQRCRQFCRHLKLKQD